MTDDLANIPSGFWRWLSEKTNRLIGAVSGLIHERGHMARLPVLILATLVLVLIGAVMLSLFVTLSLLSFSLVTPQSEGEAATIVVMIFLVCSMVAGVFGGIVIQRDILRARGRGDLVVLPKKGDPASENPLFPHIRDFAGPDGPIHIEPHKLVIQPDRTNPEYPDGVPLFIEATAWPIDYWRTREALFALHEKEFNERVGKSEPPSEGER